MAATEHDYSINGAMGGNWPSLTRPKTPIIIIIFLISGTARLIVLKLATWVEGLTSLMCVIQVSLHYYMRAVLHTCIVTCAISWFTGAFC